MAGNTSKCPSHATLLSTEGGVGQEAGLGAAAENARSCKYLHWRCVYELQRKYFRSVRVSAGKYGAQEHSRSHGAINDLSAYCFCRSLN